MRQEIFTVEATKASTRYTAYLEQILAAYNRAILSKELNFRTIKTFKDETQMLNKHFLEREVDIAVEHYNNLIKMANEDTVNLDVKVTEDEEWAEYLEGSVNFTYEALKLQSTKDALFASNFMRAKVIELMNMSDVERAYELVFKSRELNFFYTDKIGRKINSSKYVRTLVRDFYVKGYNDLIAGAAILNGIESVRIENTDINHPDHDKILSLKEQNELNYFIIRNDSFHPNTNSIVRI